jgi:hypothetical protein
MSLATRPWCLAATVGLSLAFVGPHPAHGQSILLLDPMPGFEQEWRHYTFSRATDYAFDVVGDRPAVRAIGRDSASGLFKEVSYPLKSYPWLEWAWRVDRLQESADLRSPDTDDFAAGIMVLFGRPGLFNKDVLTLNYVWTSAKHTPGSVVASVRHPSTTRHVVMRSGPNPRAAWVMERRNVLEDFRQAFGREPPDHVRIIALFTDNDQTGEPVDASYGPIRASRF